MTNNDRWMAALESMNLERPIRARIEEWLEYDLDKDWREELEQLLDIRDADGLRDRFGATMAFGTGGIRGPMGVGTNRLNSVLIATATQGLAGYILEAGATESPSAVVSYDSRINSERFAKLTACVLAGNGVRAHLFRALRPTPVLSFAVRQLGATAGVMITASHNPKEDNGYKAYWTDGAQVVEPHDANIVARVEAARAKDVKQMDFDRALEKGLIQWVGEDLDEAFFAAMAPERISPEAVKRVGGKLKIVYSALHGTGGTMVPEALRRWGFSHVDYTESQMAPDGLFPTVKSANPEDPAAMNEARRVAEDRQAGLVLATDPDGDRVGVIVRDRRGGYQLLNGNEVGSMLVHYILSERKRKGTLPANPAVVSTIVTTELLTPICEAFGADIERTLTGFKWIGKKIDDYERGGAPGKPAQTFLFGCEESVGYMVGTYTRDKDAVMGSCMIAEMAAWALDQGKTLVDFLEETMARFGIYIESQISIYRLGLEGQEDIKRLMAILRENPPAAFLGENIETVTDYQSGRKTERATGKVLGSVDLPRSNVLAFKTAGGSQVVARPSGTEPKIKFYLSSSDTRGLPIADPGECRVRRAALRERHEALRKEFHALVHRMAGWE